MFQSAPGGEAGRYRKDHAEIEPNQGFNPLPAVRPGDTMSQSLNTLVLSQFQSAPGGEAGRYVVFRSKSEKGIVSIRSRR